MLKTKSPQPKTNNSASLAKTIGCDVFLHTRCVPFLVKTLVA
jgi:hypothetical protein